MLHSRVKKWCNIVRQDISFTSAHGRKLIVISNIVDQIPMIGEMIQQLLFQDGTDGQRVVATTAC